MALLTNAVTQEIVQTENFATYLNRSGEQNEQTILFLHGSGPGVTAFANWRPALEEVGEQFQCLAPDLYGFGKSSHPDEPLKNRQEWMDQWISQTIELLDHLKLEKVHVVGNSLGCSIALELLLEYPERFDQIVLMGPGGTPNTKLSFELARAKGFYDNPSKKKLKQIMGWFVYDEKAMQPVIDSILDVRYQTAMQPEVHRSNDSIFSTAAVPVPVVALNRIENEVLLVHGLNDKVCSVESSYYLAQHLKKAQLHVFGQCGHWAQLEKKDSFHELIQAFFNKKI
ncbi:alpha/beta hydrolase [Planococcus sp. N064]|uniref:Alpha/beta hydrolase n=1 Tax=Planococcus liqunii TaxID=3058394 RepID=A0ABT8MTA9_9BACL|nr:alpha/beta hydrolase [Planococcus sp. N064]MDN7228147.1 alpha/beta hydrolase [Planococcus sp. N064]